MSRKIQVNYFRLPVKYLYLILGTAWYPSRNLSSLLDLQYSIPYQFIKYHTSIQLCVCVCEYFTTAYYHNYAHFSANSRPFCCICLSRGKWSFSNFFRLDMFSFGKTKKWNLAWKVKNNVKQWKLFVHQY